MTDSTEQEALIERNAATDLATADEIAAEVVLQADDTDADSDVARPSRVMQYRTQRRTQVSMLLPALFLMLFGVLLLAQALTPEVTLVTPLGLAGGAMGAFALGLLYRFLVNRRRETGVLFLSLVLLCWLTLGAAFALGALDLAQSWPLAISAVGVAIFVMLLFVRERGLVLPGLAFGVAGVALLMFTSGAMDAGALTAIAQYWPVLLIVLALIFLPSAFRNRTS
jgi:hypothetical protein